MKNEFFLELAKRFKEAALAFVSDFKTQASTVVEELIDRVDDEKIVDDEQSILPWRKSVEKILKLHGDNSKQLREDLVELAESINEYNNTQDVDIRAVKEQISELTDRLAQHISVSSDTNASGNVDSQLLRDLSLRVSTFEDILKSHQIGMK